MNLSQVVGLSTLRSFLRMESHMSRCFAAILLVTTLVAVEVPAVPALPDAQVYAVGVIPDLRGMLQHTSQALGAAGKTLPPGMLEMGLGGMLGDPGLTKLGNGPILVAAGPGLLVPSWGAILPYADAEAVIAAVSGAGLLAEAAPGGVAIGSAPDGPGLAKRMLPALDAVRAGMPADSDLRVVVGLDRLSQAYLPMAIAAMQGAASAPGLPAEAAGQRKLMLGMVAMLRTFAAQAGALRCDLTVSASGWKIDAVQALRPGVLADAIRPQAPSTDRPAERLGAGDGPAVVQMHGCMPPRIYEAMATLLQETRRDPAAAALIDESMVAMVRDCAGALTGSFAMRQGFAGSPMRQLGVAMVRDQAKAKALLDGARNLFSMGVLADLMRGMGVEMVFEPAVRHAAGLPVDRISYRIDPAKLPPGQDAAMQAAMMPTQEMALAPTMWVWGSPSAEIDAALAGPRGAPRLAAEALGAGWDLYADLDMALQMKMQFALMAKQIPMFAGAFAEVPCGHPMRMAAALGEGRYRLVIEVPVEQVADFRNGFAGMQRGRHQPAEEPETPAAPVF